MEQDKIVFLVRKPVPNTTTRVVRVTADTYDVIEGLQRQTGIHTSQILKRFVDFCIEKVVIKEVDIELDGGGE